MQSLHDDDNGAGLRVVQSRLERVFEEVDAVGSLRLAVRHERVLRVVYDDYVGTVTGDGAADGCAVHHSVVVVLEFVLTVDVVLEGERLAPVLLVPRTGDDVSGENVVLS